MTSGAPSITVYQDEYERQLSGGRDLLREAEDFLRLMKRGGVRPRFEGDAALDFGVGDGRHAQYLISQGYRVIGTDVSPTPLAVSERRLETTGRFTGALVPETCELPLADASVSLIAAWEVLHWLGSPELWDKAMREFLRVLSPGGSIILTMPTETHFLKTRSLEIGKSTYRSKVPGRMDCVYYSPNLFTLRHLFETELGLRVDSALRYEHGGDRTEHGLDDRFSMYGFLLRRAADAEVSG